MASKNFGIKELAYELYKVDWMRRIIPERQAHTIIDYYLNTEADFREEYSLEDYLFDNGFNGEIYVCFEEFLETEYLDKEYIFRLFNIKTLIKEYLEDIGEDFEE